jgi:hypothetical protein
MPFEPSVARHRDLLQRLANKLGTTERGKRYYSVS